MPKSIKISVDGIAHEYAMEQIKIASGASYTPTDEDLEKIAEMINRGIPQSGILFTDETTGRVYNIYVKNGKITMEESEV